MITKTFSSDPSPCKYRTIPDDLLEFIKDQLETTEYGHITIEIQGKNRRIDIVTTNRQRFDT